MSAKGNWMLQADKKIAKGYYNLGRHTKIINIADLSSGIDQIELKQNSNIRYIKTVCIY